MNISQCRLWGSSDKALSDQVILEYNVTDTFAPSSTYTYGPFDADTTFSGCAGNWGDYIIVDQTRVFTRRSSVVEIPTITPAPIANGLVGVDNAWWLYYIAADGYTYAATPRTTEKLAYNITKLNATAGSSSIVGVGQFNTQYDHSYVKAADGIYRLRGTAAYKLSFTQFPSWQTAVEPNNESNGTAAITKDQLGAYIVNNAITSLTPNQTPSGTLINTSPVTTTFQGDIIPYGIMYCYQTVDTAAPYVIWDVNVYSGSTLYLRQLCTSQTKPQLLPCRMVVRDGALFYYHNDGTEESLAVSGITKVSLTSGWSCRFGTIWVLTDTNRLYRIPFEDESRPPTQVKEVGYKRNGQYVDLYGSFAIKRLYKGYEL